MKFVRRIVPVFFSTLACCLLLTIPALAYNAWTDSGYYTQPEQFDTEEKTITITTAQELAWLAAEHSSFEGYTVYLAEDIDLTGRDWVSISTFAGTFDGQGHEIKNLTREMLFKTLEPTAVIQNVVLRDCYINSSESYIGALYSVASKDTIRNKTATILNCGVTGSVFSSKSYGFFLSGIGGRYGTLKNCYSACRVMDNYGISQYALAYNSDLYNCWWNKDLCTNGYRILNQDSDQLYGISAEDLETTDYVALLNTPKIEGGAAWTADEGGWPVLTNVYPHDWKSNAIPVAPRGDVYEIRSAGELAYIAKLVNSGNDLAGKTVRLMKDIDLSGKCWQPIGGSNGSFSGTFDGNGKTVSGLTIGRGNTCYSKGNAGLLGSISGSIVQDVAVMGQVESTGVYTGMIVGRADNSSLINCQALGVVAGEHGVGGIAGSSYGTTEVFSNCHFTGTVSGSYLVGGIVSATGAKTEITRCSVNGTVGREDCRLAGGILGAPDWEFTGTISECFTKGLVLGSGGVGGILATGDYYYKGTIRDCYTTCEIRNTDSGSGGILGSWGADGAGADIENCYAAGNVSGKSYVGMIVGSGIYAANAITTNCYWNADAAFKVDGLPATIVGAGNGLDHPTTGLSLEEMKRKDSFAGFDFNSVWAISENKNNGMPYLRWEDTADLIVLPVDISLSASSLTLHTGGAKQLTATLIPEESEGTIRWKSSNEDIVSVSQQGLVVAHSTGTAVITASCDDLSASCTVTVEARADNPYSIHSVAVTYDGESGTYIPEVDVRATVLLKQEKVDSGAAVLLAVYSDTGRFLGLYTLDEAEDNGFYMEFNSDTIENSDGAIQSIKAFVCSSLSLPLPLAEAKEISNN